MTPAINLAKKSKIAYQVHEYDHDSNTQSYGLEAAQKTAKEAAQIFKTLVVCLEDNSLAIGIIPVINTLNLKQIAKALKAKKSAMADPAQVERVTGYVLGGVSPLGQKKRLKTIIDASAQQYETILVSGGKRGVEIELSPNDLAKLTNATFNNIT